jgi:hypothetical protein
VGAGSGVFASHANPAELQIAIPTCREPSPHYILPLSREIPALPLRTAQAKKEPIKLSPELDREAEHTIGF